MVQQGTRPISCDSAGTSLCLHPPGQCPAGASCSTLTSETATSIPPSTTPSSRREQHLHQDQHQPQPQPLTVLHGVSDYASNMTEMQTRAILSAARKEVERLAASLADGDTTGSGVVAYPQQGPVGTSMKGSLRRFLEKRRGRLSEAPASPYGCSAAAR